MTAKPSDNRRGRARIDWYQAFLYYAALPPQERTYAAVADHFELSVRTVERHGLNDQWADRAREIDEQALAKAEEAVGRGRADQFADILKLAEATLLLYAQQLRDGTVRVTPADLTRVAKLISELQARDEPALPAPEMAVAADEEVPLKHIQDVLRGLYESGALTRDKEET